MGILDTIRHLFRHPPAGTVYTVIAKHPATLEIVATWEDKPNKQNVEVKRRVSQAVYGRLNIGDPWDGETA